MMLLPQAHLHVAEQSVFVPSIRDDFDLSPAGTLLVDHTPNEDAVGQGWIEYTTDDARHVRVGASEVYANSPEIVAARSIIDFGQAAKKLTVRYRSTDDVPDATNLLLVSIAEDPVNPTTAMDAVSGLVWHYTTRAEFDIREYLNGSGFVRAMRSYAPTFNQIWHAELSLDGPDVSFTLYEEANPNPLNIQYSSIDSRFDDNPWTSINTRGQLIRIEEFKVDPPA